MEELYQQQTVITPSLADASGRLGCADAFGLFMDLAASHAERLGIGLAAMAARGLFWLTVKTQIRFLRRPGLMTAVTARTWPEAPGKMRGDRSYELTRDGETLVRAFGERAARQEDGGFIVTMDAPEDKRETMEKILALGDVDGIEVVEPTLDDIFVEYAG